jgi:soluble lytic murein transglycosylase-like protein
VERWRPLVRQVMAEEWQAGTLDGLAERLDDDVILATMQQESRGNPQALSPVGAIGLMQVMPQTFALMMAGDASLASAIDPDALWDQGNNVRAGLRYLALAMQNQEGDLYWSLASYNAGIGTVKRWRMAGLSAVPPIGGYTETAEYAQIILHNYVAHRPGLDLYIPDPMPPEHVPGALDLLRSFRRR